MSFSRHGESIGPMSGKNKTGKEVSPPSPAHRHDEFQPAIPWRGCSPAEPRLRFTGRRPFSKAQTIEGKQFAANGFTGLIPCLTQGVHPKAVVSE